MPEEHTDPQATEGESSSTMEPPAGRTIELTDRIRQLEARLDEQQDQLARAESQRDEARSELVTVENRHRLSAALRDAGCVDLEAAGLLLGRELDLSEDIPSEQLQQQVESLLLNRPHLRRAGRRAGPGITSSPRDAPCEGTTQLADAAERAARSGNRRDIAEYLRLRRAALP
jgi:hypothetical protein